MELTVHLLETVLEQSVKIVLILYIIIVSNITHTSIFFYFSFEDC